MFERTVSGIMLTLLFIGMLTLAFDIQPVRADSSVYVFEIVWEEIVFHVAVESNSTVSDFNFNQPMKEVGFNVTGPADTIGFCNVTIPRSLLWVEDEWTMLVDAQLPVIYTQTENTTHSTLYFTYVHSTHEIRIIGTHVIGPTTITVPDDYPTIQEAINNANEGNTIFVRNGTYYENVVVNKTVSLIGEEKETTTIDGGEIGTVASISANDVTIQDFTIKNCKRTGGFEERSCIVIKGNNTLVMNNKIVHDNVSMSWYICIYLLQSSNNVIDGNSMKDDWSNIGIYAAQSSNNTMSKNNMTDNGTGIWLEEYSANNTIYGNIIKDNWYCGIIVQVSSHYNIFYENTITGTNWEGIFISLSSHNTFSGNIIANNGIGVSLEMGAPFNTFYHNNFINNTQGVDNPWNLITIWDNGCEGNYWSNYNGTDLDNDGIGDTELPWEGVDYYPLMNPYWNPADVDHDLDVDLYDAVRLLVAYGFKEGDEHYNPHCDIAEPYGVINLYDAVLLLVNYGKKYD